MHERKEQFKAIETLEKLRVPASELKAGMYVCELDRPWLESPFVFQGFELRSHDDIKAVREICEYVFIDVTRQKRIGPEDAVRERREPPYQAFTAAKPPKKTAPVEKEMEFASAAYECTSSLVKSMMDQIRLGHSPDIRVAKAAVSECVQSVIRNPDALMWLTQLKNKDEYTALHSLNVCLYSVAFGRYLGLPVKELENLGLCGMMHDMGKMLTPLEILNKPGKLIDHEFAIMKQHPIHGRDILMSASNLYPGIVDVAYSHHERLNGEGYPRGLDGTRISPYSKMVAIVDTYDAITSDRVYHQGKTHLEGIGILNQCKGTNFDASLVFQFIACIGIYPPGCIVEMGNGEVAIVIEVNPQHRIIPKVIMLLDENKTPQKERVVDLAKLDLDLSGQPYTIKTVLRNDAYGIDIRKYHQRGLIGHAFSG